MDKSSMHTTFHGTKRMLCMLLILIARLVMRITVECVMGDGAFVCNFNVYSTGIGMPGLTVKTIDVNKMFMVVNN